MNAIRIITTGGTIDNLEYSSEADAPKNHQTLIKSLLEQGKVTVAIGVTELMQKDSKFVNDDDRKRILEECKNSAEERIVITHGTMSLSETARYLFDANLSKTIVLVGAAVP